MKVSSAYHPGAVYVTPSNTLREAAVKMRTSGQSCLPVVEGSNFEGIVTERDLTEAMANGAPSSEEYVVDYCNDGSVSVTLNDDCEVAGLKMLAIGCRNLPVLEAGKLVGMISMRDVVLKTAAHNGRRVVPDRARELVAQEVLAGPADWPEEPAPDADDQA